MTNDASPRENVTGGREGKRENTWRAPKKLERSVGALQLIVGTAWAEGGKERGEREVRRYLPNLTI